MHLSLSALLLLAHQIYPIHGVQIGRGLPGVVIDPSALSLMTTRHIGYVDQRTRQNAHTYLNHEQWHRRRTLISWNSSSEISSGASTASVLSSAASTAALNATHYTASNTTTLRVANLGNLLHTTEALATVSSADWDNQTDAACSSSLSSLNGIPSNPSGTSACYNIRSLDNSTGAFEVDLRLYRVAAPTGDWSQLGGLDFSLDLLFYGATVQASSTRKSKRGVVRITLPSVQKYDARGLYRMRLNDATPKTLNRSRFWGKTDQAFEVEIMNETMIRSILTPNITLSGTTQNGTYLSTRLPNGDASFVCGVLASNITTNETLPVNQDHFLLPGTTSAFFPTSLIITGVWALLLLMTIGYETMTRIQARDTYRRRLKSRLSGGGGRIRQF